MSSTAKHNRNTTGQTKKGKNIMKKNYFETAKTAEEVKQLYKKLVRDLHPDNNIDKDTTADFQEMQNQFKAAFERLKNVHVNAEGQTYTKETTETPEEFMEMLDKLMKMNGLYIELCGSWLWVSGNTKEHKDELKAMNFKWSKNKAAWYFHFEPYRKRTKGTCSMDKIREMYGSQRYESEEQARITA